MDVENVLSAGLWGTVLVRNVDKRGEIDKHENYLQEAYEAGKGLVKALQIEG